MYICIIAYYRLFKDFIKMINKKIKNVKKIEQTLLRRGYINIPHEKCKNYLTDKVEVNYSKI